MHLVTLIFLLLVILTAGLRFWLTWRQQAYVIEHRYDVPDAFMGHITPEQQCRASMYTSAKIRLGWVVVLINTLLLLIWTLGGGLSIVDNLWTRAGLGTLITGVAVILTFLLVNGIVSIPVKAWRSFVLEARFGFNRMTYQTFITDLARNALLVGVIAASLSYMTLWLMQAAEYYWWFYVWILWTGFALFMTWAYPSLIAPMFNRFSPLRDEALQLRIKRLLQRCGFNSDGVFVIDGSRRSAHGNAYFSGLGKNKRIVFFDTLLDSLSPAQIESVLAHELGHFKRAHVIKNMTLTTGASLAALLLLAWLSDHDWFYTGLGVDMPSAHMALLLFILIGPLVLFLLQPARAWLSRRYEFEADEFAASHADATQLINALLALYRNNASTLNSDPWYSAVYDSHPSAPVRILNLKRLAGLAHST